MRLVEKPGDEAPASQRLGGFAWGWMAVLFAVIVSTAILSSILDAIIAFPRLPVWQM